MTLSTLSGSWDAGIHAILGAPRDGGSLLLDLVAGFERPRRGRIRVLGGDPLRAPNRSRIALVPLRPFIPDALCVGEILRMAAALRGERSNEVDRLRALGIESLELRLARTLTAGESRAVMLAEAIGSSKVRVLLIEEPRIRLDPRAMRRLHPALQAFAADGGTVILATSSARDASELADDVWELRSGQLQGPRSSLPRLDAAADQPQSLRVLASNPRVLSTELAREASVEGITWDAKEVRVHGSNARALAEAVGRAIAATEVDVTLMRFEVP